LKDWRERCGVHAIISFEEKNQTMERKGKENLLYEGRKVEEKRPKHKKGGRKLEGMTRP